VEHFLSSSGYIALLVLTFAEAACVPIPSEVTLTAAGYLVSTGRMELGVVIVIAVLGETAGSFVGWGIGRFGGRPLVERFGRYVLLTARDLDRAEAWFTKRGESAVVIGRMLPFIRTFISIPAGLAEMKPLRFGVATFIGSLVWCTALTLVGYELGKRWNEVTKGFSYAGYVLIAAFVVLAVVFMWHRFRLVRSERSGSSA
jgi:membrane protein DedA with SNARE-associated domain